MSLQEQGLFENTDKVAIAIQTLKELEPPEGYYVADSGGKDSTVILELVKMSGVKFDAHHNLTTIDPPEVIWFIKKHHPETKIELPDKPFLQRLAEKGFPQRMRRWCCADYKERGGAGRLVITGIRAEESTKRAGRKMVEACYKGGGRRFLNIIIHWSEGDVWDFIKSQDIPYCKLYDEGWKRVGCLFCPMAGKHRVIQAEKYPKHVELFRKAFRKLHATGRESMNRWKDGDAMFDWWLNEPDSEDPDQGVLFE
jgi:phosphoadenosine phosphosulfate reductase